MIVWLGKDTDIKVALKALAPCGVGAFLDTEGVAVYRDLVRQKLVGIKSAGQFPYPSWYKTVKRDGGHVVLSHMPQVKPLDMYIPPEIESMLSVVKQHDFNGYIYIVGGFVRDTILGRKTYDVDISVYGDFRLFTSILQGRYEIKKFPLGIKLSIGPYKIDFTFSRYDYYTSPGKMPIVIPSSISADLERRDFTIGAISYLIYPYKGLIDAFHSMDDLQQGLLRYIRLYAPYEDPSRVLRGIRYSEVLKLTFDSQTEFHSLEALRMKTHLIISRRYFRELENLINAVGIRQFMAIERHWGILRNLTGEMYDTILRHINYIDSYKQLKLVLMLVYDKQGISAGYSVLGITRRERKIFEKCKGERAFIECIRREGL
jgi:tRNA nucleotidyltransferase/poly(A) polymerase